MDLHILNQLYNKLNWKYVDVRSGMFVKRVTYDTTLDKDKKELLMRKIIYMGDKFDYRQLYYDIIIKIDPKTITTKIDLDRLTLKDFIFENKKVYCIVTDKRYNKYGKVTIKKRTHYLPLWFWIPVKTKNKFENLVYNIKQYTDI